MKKISIIVPVYNAEAYIKSTLESIAAQTYRNIEVILVDDGSIDSSGVICAAFAASDKRFRYYRIKNGGPSNARNIGISLAHGEYVGFCDSDDLIHTDMYKTLVGYLENSCADLALCDIYSERDQRKFGFPWKDSTVFQDGQIGDVLVASMVGNIDDNDKSVPLWGSVVRCLFRKEIIEENKILFPTDIHFAEDLVFTLTYLTKTKKAIICDKDFYYYCCNESSIMHSFFTYKRNMFIEREKLVEYICAVIQNFANKIDLRNRLAVTERSYYRECVGNACRKGENRDHACKHKEVHEILNHDLVKSAFKSYSVSDIKTKFIYFLIKNRLENIILLYYWMRF